MRKINLYKSVCLIYAMLLLFSFLSCGNPDNRQPYSTFQYSSYRDIPGVTEDEIMAIEALKSARQRFVYVNPPTTEVFELPDGTKAGFVPMFCELLSDLFGIPFIHEVHVWGDMISGMEDGTVDFTSELTPTPERRLHYFMTLPIAERFLSVFTYGDSEKIMTENDVNGLRLGFFEDTITAQSIMNGYPRLTFEQVTVSTIQEVAEKLANGEIDAYVDDSVTALEFEEYDFMKSKIFFPLVYSPVSLATANPELKPVISVMDKYIAAGGIDRLYELYREGNHEYAKYKLDMSFTAEEKAYLESLSANGVKVPVALEHDNYPACFYDKNKKRFEGIAVDILAEISRITGIEFDIVTTQNTTWSEILDKLKAGEAALVSELGYSEERKNNFLWTDRPYAVSSYILMSKSDYPSLEMYQVSRAAVGLVRGTIYDELYNEWFPGNTNARYYDNQADALIALERGVIDLLMESEYGLLAQTNLREKPGYKTNIQFRSPTAELFFGFNKNEEFLRSIFSKSRNFINYDEIVRAWTGRTYDYEKKYAHERFIYMTVFASILLLFLLFLSILFVKNRRAGKQLEVQSEAVLAASRAKSAFLAHMSHEIRTPLNAIIGMSYILEGSVDNNEKALRGVNQIITSSHHLLGILNDILDMSKIESGKLELTCEPFSLFAACEEVSDIVTHRCVEKYITFITNIYEVKNITVLGDKLRLNQVLINLLGNAVKFTSTNGEIKFIVEVMDFIPEESTEKVQVKFSVSDNGIGMSGEQIRKLFIPFEQADTTIAARFGGTGLGLSISQNLITMMGGRISVTSELNKGSTFYFSLSFDKGQLPAGETADEKHENVNLKGKRMLLAEDIEINRLIVYELLSLTGLNIDEVENGRQAIDVFNGSPEGYYDIILMDIQMPVLDGYEAAKGIRALDRTDAKTVPIIAMTANAYKEDVEEALAAGMNGHLAKPINKPAFMETVGKILKGMDVNARNGRA